VESEHWFYHGLQLRWECVWFWAFYRVFLHLKNSSRLFTDATCFYWQSAKHHLIDHDTQLYEYFNILLNTCPLCLYNWYRQRSVGRYKGVTPPWWALRAVS
jgi:hypothetical protein